jgi:hypothetical protein
MQMQSVCLGVDEAGGGCPEAMSELQAVRLERRTKRIKGLRNMPGWRKQFVKNLSSYRQSLLDEYYELLKIFGDI